MRQLTQRGQERLREKEVCPNHAHIIHAKYTQNTYDTFGVSLYLPGMNAEVSQEFYESIPTES